MAPGRLALAVVAVLGLDVSGASQVQPLLPGPPGYQLVDSSESPAETEEFSVSPLGRQRVTGRRLYLLYEPRPLLRKRPLDILRHYVSVVEARGGSRLFGYVDDVGGQLWLHVPAPKPIWIDARPSESGAGLEIIMIEETTPEARRLPIPAERIEGRWGSDDSDLSMYAASDRPHLKTLFDRTAARWRSTKPLTPPMGATFSVITPSREDAPVTGPLPFDMLLIARPRFQSCADCPVEQANEGRRLVDVSINQPEKAATQSGYEGPNDEEWFEWHVESQETPTIVRTRDGRLMITQPNRPSPWIPVTQEAFLRAQIASLDAAARPPDLKKALAEQEEAIRAIEKLDPAAAKAARAAMAEALSTMGDVKGGLAPERARLEEELKGLSSEDRRKPATLPGGAALVRKNPGYFRTDLAATVPQLVVVTYAAPQDYFLVDLVDRLKSAVEWTWLVDPPGTSRR